MAITWLKSLSRAGAVIAAMEEAMKLGHSGPRILVGCLPPCSLSESQGVFSFPRLHVPSLICLPLNPTILIRD